MKSTKKTSLLTYLQNINKQRQNRVVFINQLLNDPKVLLEVIAIAKDERQEVSGKAARAIELTCIQNQKLILNHIESIFEIIESNKRDDVVRPMAKILEVWVINHFSRKASIELQERQKEKITSICFDWLISSQKTAAQAYSMQSLYLLGKETAWIHPELKLILEKNYAQGSYGYQARSRKILNQIKI